MDRDDEVDALLDQHGLGFVALLVGEREIDLRRALGDLIDIRSLRLEVIDLLDAAEHGRVVPAESPVFGCESGRALKGLLGRPGIGRVLHEQKDPRPICARCYIVLTPQAATDLEYYRVAHCKMCGHFTIRTAP